MGAKTHLRIHNLQYSRGRHLPGRARGNATLCQGNATLCQGNVALCQGNVALCQGNVALCQGLDLLS